MIGRLGALLLLGGMLAAAIAWEITDMPRAGVAAGQSHIALARPQTGPALAAHVRAWVATVLARPLFSPNRRPSEAADISDAKLPGLPRLTGIVVGPFGRRAIFAGDGRKSIVVDEGGHIDAYTVTSIGVGQVQLSGPNGRQRVEPAFDAAARQVAAGPRVMRRVGQGAVAR